MDLRKLLQKVETAPVGSPELDSEFVCTFRSAPSNVTRSIDAAVQLIETDLRGWWWNSDIAKFRNGASLYVPGSSRIRANFPGAKMSSEYGSDPGEDGRDRENAKLLLRNLFAWLSWGGMFYVKSEGSLNLDSHRAERLYLASGKYGRIISLRQRGRGDVLSFVRANEDDRLLISKRRAQ